MPKLRHYKNFDWLAPGESNNNDNDKGAYPNDDIRDEQSSSGDITESRQYEGIEDFEATGNSWLSNRSIIASLTDDKLRQTVKHYRALISLLEAEILSRSFTPKRHSAENRRTSRKLDRPKAGVKSDSSDNGRSSDISQLRSMRRMLRQLKLSVEEKRKLFEEWNKIQKEAENE